MSLDTMKSPSSSQPSSPRENPLPWILVLSALITAFLVWWVYFKTTASSEAPWIELLPALNATFNTLCAMCLVAGFLAIRNGRRTVHQRLMVSGVVFSALFLASYLLYHHFHGDTPFPGQGWVRPVYFTVLISHIVLSVVMLPMILATLTFAGRKEFDRHRKIARITLPIWLYVSVTGVVIFFFLKAYVG